jgi:hypothetical protein
LEKLVQSACTLPISEVASEIIKIKGFLADPREFVPAKASQGQKYPTSPCLRAINHFIKSTLKSIFSPPPKKCFDLAQDPGAGLSDPFSSSLLFDCAPAVHPTPGTDKQSVKSSIQ